MGCGNVQSQSDNELFIALVAVVERHPEDFYLFCSVTEHDAQEDTSNFMKIWERMFMRYPGDQILQQNFAGTLPCRVDLRAEIRIWMHMVRLSQGLWAQGATSSLIGSFW